CETSAVLAAANLTMRDLFPETKRSTPRIVATYRYEDEGRAHLYDVVRFEPKDFRQRRADGTWSLKGVRRVLYRLPDLHGQTVVYAPEGERDADRLAALGLPATTALGGAGKWRDDYARQLTTAGVESIVILPDNDEPGRAHADAVARSCHAAALQVKVVTLPDLPVKGDVSDWLAAGHSKDELIALVKATPLYVPTATTPTNDPDDTALLTGLSDLLSEPDDALDWLVTDRFASGSINLLAGKPKAGKSTLARALALAVARGASWLGSRCHQGRVVYIALEDKRSEVRRHLRAMGATGAEPIRFLIGSAPRDLLTKLAALMTAGDTIDLLIIDTAQRLLTVKDSNDYALVTAAFEPVLALARTHGTCIVLLHHAGKADRGGLEAVMGSTAWAASVDNVMILNRRERYRLVSTVQRIGPDMDETVVEMDELTGDVRLAGSRYLADLDHVAAAVLALVADAGGQGIGQIAALADVEARRDLKLKALRLLLDKGSLIRAGAGHRHDPYVLRVSDPEPDDRSPRDEDGISSGSQVPPTSWEPDEPSLTHDDPTEVSKASSGSRVCLGSHVPGDGRSGVDRGRF
ncbi:MAG TPA: AAA family ATPase, partial [Gemmatimonadaceae bacterium]|nr:AAA family ATPase [Gemmatimonadaceae bacterium]